MISVSQAVQSLNNAGSAASVQLSRTALVAAASPPLPSAILSLGTSLPGLELYDASGLLAAAFADEVMLAAPQIDTTSEQAPTSPAPTAAQAPGTESPATVSPATVSPALPLAAENTGTAEPVATPSTASVFVDPTARALADFRTNPVHGAMASALFINAAIYNTREISAASVVTAIDWPEPVNALNAVNVDIADLGRRSAEPQRSEVARSAVPSSRTLL